MQLINFAIGGQNIDLEWADGGYADLHNDFTFDKFLFEPSVAKATLEWRKSEGEWAQNVTISSLGLIFLGVSFLRIRERDSEYTFPDDACLAEVGWLPQDERDNFDSFCLTQDAELTYDLLFYFESGWAIKLNADTVELALKMI
ncbi:hypothetical protein [uncultured Hymenobacter sp.]|uniref:hypothetical protein n=1 Tax=uncultured Hymenobacter sp. TaxID=170016 RepID=UPI0035CA5986